MQREGKPAKRIQSRDNAWYKSLQRLAASSRERRAQGRAIIDGPHLVEAWGANGAAAEVLIVSETGYGRPEARELFDRTIAKQRVVLTDQLFDAVAQVSTPVGIMAVVPTPGRIPPPDRIGDAVFVDGVQDPGNLGSILRTAAAAASGRSFYRRERCSRGRRVCSGPGWAPISPSPSSRACDSMRSSGTVPGK